MTGRDIYDVANQLEGYVGPDTPEPLAQFLLREGKEAAKLADEIVRLRAARSTVPEAGKAVDIAQLLTNCAQIIDVVKGEWSKEGAWSEWDQSVRDDISKALSALASVPAPSGAPQAVPAEEIAGLIQKLSARHIDWQLKCDHWIKKGEEDGLDIAGDINALRDTIYGQAAAALTSLSADKAKLVEWAKLIDERALASEAEATSLRRALTKIEKWFGEFPETGEFWDEEKTRPISYGAQFGSNGERDYMRAVARQALSGASERAPGSRQEDKP